MTSGCRYGIPIESSGTVPPKSKGRATASQKQIRRPVNWHPAWIVSFPKSGRTWLKVMLGKALSGKSDIDAETTPEVSALTAMLDAATTKFTHDDSSLQNGRPFDELHPSKERFRDGNVILLLRDPRDILVSCYFQATRRRVTNGQQLYDGSLSSFLHDERYGIRKCAAFYRIWAENQNVPRRFLLVRYEEMQRDPAGILRSVLEVLDLPEVSPSAIENAVSFGEFDNMQRLESAGSFDDKILRPRNSADPESFKVRRGKVGGYRDYVSDADSAYMDEILAREGGPFCGAYLNSIDPSTVT